MSASRSSGNSCSTTSSRISLPTSASRRTSSVSRSFSSPLIRSLSPVSPRKDWYAAAVVAKPSGTLHAQVGEVGDHLAEGGVLAADLLDVAHAELGEPPDSRHPVHVQRSAFFLLRGQGLDDQGGHLLDRAGRGVDDRDAVRGVQVRRAPELPAALVGAGVLRARPPLVADPAQPLDRGDQPDALVHVLVQQAGQVVALEVLVDQRVVGHEQAVLEREVHARRRLAAPRGRDHDDVGLLQAAHALAVVVLDGELDGRHPGVVAADVADPVQPGRLVQAAGAEHLLDPAHVDVEEVDDRRASPSRAPAGSCRRRRW